MMICVTTLTIIVLQRHEYCSPSLEADTTHRTDTPTISCLLRQCDTSEENANISNLSNSQCLVGHRSHGSHSQHMQDRHERRQCQEIRVRLQQHSLNLVKFRSSTSLLLRRLIEARRHGREHLEFHVRHRLEGKVEGNDGRRCVELVVVRLEVPEFVEEGDGLVLDGDVAFGVLVWGPGDVCTKLALVRGV